MLSRTVPKIDAHVAQNSVFLSFSKRDKDYRKIRLPQRENVLSIAFHEVVNPLCPQKWLSKIFIY